MSDWPMPGLHTATTPDGERGLVSVRRFDATTIPRQTYWQRGDDVPLTDVVPVTPVPTAALNSMRAHVEDMDCRYTEVFLAAVDALNERTQP